MRKTSHTIKFKEKIGSKLELENSAKTKVFLILQLPYFLSKIALKIYVYNNLPQAAFTLATFLRAIF